MKNNAWRLIELETPGSPVWNMAVDEALLALAQIPTLRFYSWDRPALSVGYFQDPHKAAGLAVIRAKGLSVVRRITGGGWVEHGADLTLSITADESDELFCEGANESYRRIHALIHEALRPLIPGLRFVEEGNALSPRSNRACFEEPSTHDLCVGERKIAGSSQRRKDGRVLHQTSIQTNIDTAVLAAAIAEGFGARLSVPLFSSGLTDFERAEAFTLLESKFRDREFWSECGSEHFWHQRT